MNSFAKKKALRVLLGSLILTFPLLAHSGQETVKSESKNFNTMRACVGWIDSMYPNKEWHSARHENHVGLFYESKVLHLANAAQYVPLELIFGFDKCEFYR